MRRVNRRVVGAVCTTAALLATATWGLHRFQVNRTMRTLLARADAAEAAGRPDLAAADLGGYLALQPADQAARAHHARLLDAAADDPESRTRAAAAYRRLLERRPGQVDVRRRLAELAMLDGRYDEARTHWKVLERALPADLSASEQLARCDAATGRADAAAQRFREILAREPGRRISALGLAALLRGDLHDPAAADRVIDARVDAEPDSALAHLDRARYRAANGLPGADDDLAHACRLAPDDPDVLLETARAARRNGKPDAARADLERAVAVRPAAPILWSELADLEYQAGRVHAARATLERGLKAVGDEPALLWTLACLMAEHAEPADLAAVIPRLRARSRHYLPAALEYLDGCLALRQGRSDAAAKLLEHAQARLQSRPDLKARANFLLARAREGLGQTDKRIEAYERVLTIDAGSLEARLGLAGALAAAGDVDRARAEYRRVSTAHPDDPRAAREWARFVQTHGPREEVEPALRAVAEHAADPADAAGARRALAVWLATDRSRLRDALSLVDPASNDPDDLRTRTRLLAALGGLADRRAALDLLKQAAATPSDRLLLAGLYESVGDHDAALRQTRAVVPDAAALTPRELAAAADRLLRRGDLDAAADWIARLDAAAPGEPGTLILRARLARARGDARWSPDPLVRYAQTHQDATPEVAAALENLGRSAQAESLLRQAGRGAAGMLAAFLARQGRTAEALAACDEAWEGVAPIDAASAVVEVFDESGPDPDPAALDRAAGRVAAAVAADPRSTALRDRLAVLREFQGRYDDAERLYRESLALAPRGPSALNNLAFLLALRGDPRGEAPGLIARALDAAGPRHELLDTRAVVRIARDDPSGAVDDLAEALLAEPAGPYYYHLALAHLARGAPDDALRAYRQIAPHLTPSSRRRIAMEECLRPGRLRAVEDRVAGGERLK